ncbi:MAG: hypothetical protein U1D30_14280 [Planctomycetota bacterium]
MLDANQVALELASEAPRKPFRFTNGDFENDVGSVSPMKLVELAVLFWLSARGMEEKGELDDALRQYELAMRTACHIAHAPVSRHGFVESIVETTTFKRILAWAARPNQTSERIKKAIALLDALEREFPGPLPLLSLEIRQARHQVETFWSNGGEPDKNTNGEHVHGILAWLPWEKFRTLRLMNQSFDAAAREAKNLENQLTQSFAGPCRVHSWSAAVYGNNGPSIRPPGLTDAAENVIQAYVERVRDFRARKVQLALLAWKAEHGELPATLDVLVGSYFETLPIDPYSGEPFFYVRDGLEIENKQIPPPVRPGQAFLWSGGENQEKLLPQSTADGDSRQYFIVDALGRIVHGNALGIAFPLPREMGK